MVSQYWQRCQEEEFEPLSRATMFSCPQAGCSLSFTSFDSLQSHLDYEQHETKISQESIYGQFRRDWAARFSTIYSENCPKPKVHISSVANSSLSMGWALQKPRIGGKRYSPRVKDYLKARFDVGEQSGQKADPSSSSSSSWYPSKTSKIVYSTSSLVHPLVAKESNSRVARFATGGADVGGLLRQSRGNVMFFTALAFFLRFLTPLFLK